MSFRSRLPILSFILRHNSKIKNFRQEVCYGDEVVEKKNPVSKKSRILTSTTTQIYDGTSSGLRFPELSADDHNFLDALKIASGLAKPPLKSSGNQTILLEGYRLIRDAVRSGGQVVYLLFSSRDVLQEIPEYDKIPNVYFVPHRILKQWSRLKTPPGILAILRVPGPSSQSKTNNDLWIWKPLPAILILDNIRDPGNLGSLLRTAAGFGLHSVLVSKDISNKMTTNKAVSRSVSSALISHSQISDESVEGDDDDNDEERTPLQLDSSEAAFRLPLPQSPHFTTDYFPNITSSPSSLDSTVRASVALVVGGEAHGLSPEAYHLAHLTDGSRIYVPIAPETESLNVLSAASAILGEMQRQYITSYRQTNYLCK